MEEEIERTHGETDMTQLDIFEPGTMSPMETRFVEFHAANPLVYRLFCKFADQVYHRGYERFSSDGYDGKPR